MFKKLFLGLVLTASTGHSSTDKIALLKLNEMSEGNPGCAQVLSKLMVYEAEETGHDVTYYDFVFNPDHNKYYQAILSKNLDAEAIWRGYRHTYDGNLDDFINYLLY